jgi:hypothetical protein
MKFRVIKAAANMICTYQAEADPILGCLGRVLVDLMTQPDKLQYPCVLRADSMSRIHIYHVREDFTLEDMESLPKDEDDICGIVRDADELKRNILARLA